MIIFKFMSVQDPAESSNTFHKRTWLASYKLELKSNIYLTLMMGWLLRQINPCPRLEQSSIGKYIFLKTKYFSNFLLF